MRQRNDEKKAPMPSHNKERDTADSSMQESHPNDNWQRYVEEPIIRFRELLRITRVGRSKAYLLMNPKSIGFDPDYPTGFPLFDSPRSPKAFYRHEAIAWVEKRANKQRQIHKGSEA